MTRAELARREERARTGDWIISETDQGFRIYSPTDRSTSYLVTGVPDDPECTCPDYEFNSSDPDWRCKHILAVQQHLEGNGRLRDAGAHSRPLGSRLLIKRSVSPDGKIDSLSVEVSTPIDGTTASQAEDRATRLMGLGDRIVDRFLNANGNGHRPERRSSQRPRRPDSPHRRSAERRRPENGAMPAQLSTIRGEEGKWGRRLYITVQTDNGYLRLYGTERQLADHIRDAGYPQLAEPIEEDAPLRVPCRIVTEETADGYVEITRVLPPARDSRLQVRDR